MEIEIEKGYAGQERHCHVFGIFFLNTSELLSYSCTPEMYSMNIFNLSRNLSKVHMEVDVQAHLIG